MATLLAGLGVTAGAQSFTTQRFDVLATVNPDRTVTVTERIEVNFFEAKRGLLRNIPLRTTDGQRGRTVQIQPVQVRRNGQPVPYQASEQGSDLVFKIGDPNRTIIGAQAFEIRYVIRRSLREQPAAGDLPARTEWFWNVVPHNWPTAINAAKVSVAFPKSASEFYGARMLADARGGRAGIEAFNGQAVRGRSDLLSVELSPHMVTFESKRPLAKGGGMTVVLGLARGTLATAEDDADIRQMPRGNVGAGSGQEEMFADAPWEVKPTGSPWWSLVFGLPAALVGYRAWKRKPKNQGPLVTRFDPPDGIGPSETGFLMDGAFNSRDLVAGLIAIAQKGAGRIRSEGEELTFELFSERTGRRVYLKEEFTPFENELHEKLRLIGPVITPQVLREGFGVHYRSLKHLIVRLAKEGDLYDASRKSSGYLGCLAFSAVLVGAFLLFPILGPWICPGVILGVIALSAAGAVGSPYSERGAKVRHHLLGLREFINRANKDELRYIANREPDQALFERLLPYAIAFGLVKKWVGAFEGINLVTPDWYASDAVTSWLIYDSFANSLNNMTHDFGDAAHGQQTFDSSSDSLFSSGSSGFGSSGSGGWDSGGGSDGGGGFDSGASSGDGGGGGGGGDW